MESSSISSPQTFSIAAGSKRDPGNPEVEDGPQSSKCPGIPTMLHAGKATRYLLGDWGSWPVLFPVSDDEISNDCQISLSVPPPPLYVPCTPSPSYSVIFNQDDSEKRTFENRTIGPFNTVRVEQKPGLDGEYDEKFKEFAREAIEWYNNEKCRKFKLHKLLEVVTHPVSCIICVLKMEAVDTDDPNNPPLIFKGEYWWQRIGEKDGVQFCHPL